MNIFIELYKYKPNDYITPEENYFTQSFKVILSKYPKLARQIVSLLNEKKLSAKKLEILSQQPHNSGKCIIDMEVKDENGTLLLIEIKLESKEGREQLLNYCKLKKGKVVYITKYDEECDDKIISHFYWSQIYNIINNYIMEKKNAGNIELLKEFLEFMGAKDMSGFRGLPNNTNHIWEKFIEKVYSPNIELTKMVKERLKNKGYICKNIRDEINSEYPQHYFYFYPKGKEGAYKNADINPFYSLYLNNEVIAAGNDFKKPEGIVLSIGVSSRKLNVTNTNEQANRGLIWIDKIKGQWLAVALLNKIIKNTDPIKIQLSKTYRFCDDAILLLNKEFKNNNIEIKI